MICYVFSLDKRERACATGMYLSPDGTVHLRPAFFSLDKNMQHFGRISALPAWHFWDRRIYEKTCTVCEARCGAFAGSAHRIYFDPLTAHIKLHGAPSMFNLTSCETVVKLLPLQWRRRNIWNILSLSFGISYSRWLFAGLNPTAGTVLVWCIADLTTD